MLILFLILLQDKPFPIPVGDITPQTYVAYRTPAPLTLDGKLDDPSWLKAPWTNAFADISGPGFPKPQHRTRAKLLWDDTYVYIGAYLDEPHVWAKLTKRDAVIFYDNDFEVFIDPDGDTHNYYELEVNAFGTEWDLFLGKPYRDGGPALHAWDIPGLITKIHVDGTLNDPSDTDTGWSVEIAIPLQVLKEATDMDIPPKEGQRWRFGFSRVQWRTHVVDGKYEKVINPKTGKPYPEDNWVWSPQGLVNMHYPERWGYVMFTETSAGSKEAPFIADPDQAAYDALYRLYYAQRRYEQKHGRYADRVSKLGMKPLLLKDYQWPPRLVAGQKTFEAVLEPIGDRAHRLVMQQDGRFSRAPLTTKP